ncbi:hypothetical protein [Kurthia senegalensis]|nr:hypothetical protein [Kurthia senegalensis]
MTVIFRNEMTEMLVPFLSAISSKVFRKKLSCDMEWSFLIYA